MAMYDWAGNGKLHIYDHDTPSGICGDLCPFEDYYP